MRRQIVDFQPTDLFTAFSGASSPHELRQYWRARARRRR